MGGPCGRRKVKQPNGWLDQLFLPTQFDRLPASVLTTCVRPFRPFPPLLRRRYMTIGPRFSSPRQTRKVTSGSQTPTRNRCVGSGGSAIHPSYGARLDCNIWLPNPHSRVALPPTRRQHRADFSPFHWRHVRPCGFGRLSPIIRALLRQTPWCPAIPMTHTPTHNPREIVVTFDTEPLTNCCPSEIHGFAA